MKMYRFILSTLFAVVAGSALADECSVTIDSTDTMRFDKNIIAVNKTCEKFTVNLTHSGKLAENVMGHNWVLTKAEDAHQVATDGVAAGLENNYLKPGDERVIAATDIIGGGEKTSVTFAPIKLSADQTYTFFCSFPGHITLMKGTVVLNP